MPLLDRLTNAVRRGIEATLPWYSPHEDAERRVETERIRVQSMRARLHVEDIARRYNHGDKVIRR